MLGEWITQGIVFPVVDKCYPLADAVEAHRYSESRRVRGKLVLIIDEQLATAVVEAAARVDAG